MITISTEQLWERLVTAGLVTGDKPPQSDQHSPWFVRVMLGFAGWIGALFLLGFVGVSLGFIFRNSTAALITGIAVCTAAAFIFRASRGKDFAVQFGLAVSFAGQALFIFGLMSIFRWGGSVSYLAIMIFEAVLAVVIINTIHRVVSAFAAAVSFSFALSSFGMPHLAPSLITAGFVFVLINELTWANRGPLVRPVGYGLALALMYINGALLMHTHIWLGGMANSSLNLVRISYWAGIILNSAVFIFAVSRLLSREGFGFNDRLTKVALIAALAIAISSFKAPGIITGLVIVLLGYANGNRVLTGFGIFALISYLSHYYYQMQATLLIKSAALVTTGIVLLIARFLLDKIWSDKSQIGGIHA
ncbi:MAG: hypothetical protein A2X59_03900 [Nitrospirae bacterium GWC2_42_7]|nr:MAG: hypothetical protein A2X59_03900 [Nitrospirae bacterium GWC2_42_7]